MKDTRIKKIALIQMAMSSHKDENIKKAMEQVDDAAKQGAEIICLPELFCSQYFCQTENPELFELAETIPGPTTDQFAEIAKKHSTVIILSLFEQRALGLYHNTTVTLDTDGGIAGIYRKMHIPDDPGYYEKYYFTPGDLGFQAIETNLGKVGTLICWDQWYPEAARLTALKGAPILFYPTAIGWHPHEKAEYGESQKNAWMTIQKSHAIANGVFVAAINRVGHEVLMPNTPGIEFWGHSFVADPFGNILQQAGLDEEILIVDINLSKIEETRRNWPFLRDRRIESYGEITHRYLER